MANLGTLTLDVVAKIGGFTAGLGSAEREAKKRAAAIEKVFDSAATAAGIALGSIATAGIAAFAALNKGLDYAASFQDLAEETGAAAEYLASFAVAAGTAGVSMESIAGATIRLTKGLTGVDDESKAAGAAIAALGLNIEAFKQLDAAQQYEAIGKALSGFADGAGKTAVAVALFGKAGAEQLKVFKALDEAGGRQIILTQEQIEAADALKDAQGRLTAELGLYGAAVATQFVGPTNEVIKVVIAAVREMLGLTDQARTLGANTGVRDFAQSAAVAITYLLENIGNAVSAIGTLGRAAQLIGTNVRLAAEVGSFAISGGLVGTKGIKDAYAQNEDAFNKLSNSFKATVDRAKVSEGKKLRELFDQQNRVSSDPEIARLQARARAAQPTLPQLNFQGAAKKPPRAGGGGAQDDPTKKLLENQLKEFDRYINAERDLMSQRNKFLDIYNQQGLVSIKDYYDSQQSILDEGTRNQVEAYQKQIDAIKAYQAGLPSKGKDTERADAQGKINDLLDKQAKLQQAAGLSALEMGIRQQTAVKEYRDALTDLQAQVQEMNGNLGAAAGLRFDQSNDRRRQMFTAEGNSEALKMLDSLKQYQVTQAELNKLQQQFALTQGDLQLAEERITMARERGTMGEIESLQKSGEARRQQYGILQQQIKAFDQLKMSMTLTPEQLQQYDRLKLQLDQLGSTLDPLADKFDTLFQDKASDAFSDFITGAKSAKDAFKSFADSFAQEVQRMFIKDLAKQLFGGDGGIGSWFSKTLGGSSGGKAGGGFDISKLFSSFAGLFAEGGSIRSGQWGIAGEAGPEVIHGPATVIPMTRMAGAGSTNITVNVLPGATRETGYQAAREMARELSRSGRR